MNGRGNLQQPRHPSLDNLRRPLNTRSYPQLPNVYDNGNASIPGAATEEEEEETPLFQIVMGLIGAAAAFWCFIGLLLLLSILYMTVRPFSLSLYRRLAATLGASSFLDAMSLLLPNQTLVVTGDSDVPSPVGTSLLVCNHLIEGDGTDWWSLFMLGRSVGLRGSLKVFLRNECLGLHPQKQKTTTSSTSSAALVHQAGGGGSDDKTVTFHTRLSNGATTATSNGSPPTPTNGNHAPTERKATMWVSMCAQMLHTLLDFPVLSNENQYIEEREDLFSLLKSFAETTETPVHLLLFPEGWSLLNGDADPKAVLAKSLDFAIREGRPQLKHLLLPRTTGFNASLESLRESNPVVYDVTLASPPSRASNNNNNKRDISISSLWKILRQPSEVHMRIKRYSMEEVLQDASWLDKQWAEKDRLLTQFARHGSFPSNDSRFSVIRHRVFHTRHVAVESSVLALLRLLILPTFCPILLVLSIPMFWSVFWLWILYKSFQIMIGNDDRTDDNRPSSMRIPTPSESRAGTPFVPATPFGSPSVSNWRDMIGNNNNNRHG